MDHLFAWWLTFRSAHFGHKGQCRILKIARLLIGDQAVKWTLLMVCIPVSAPSIHCWIMLFWIRGGSFVDCRQLVESTSGWPELRAFFASAPINGWPGKHSWPAKDKTRRIESRNATRRNEQIYFEKIEKYFDNIFRDKWKLVSGLKFDHFFFISPKKCVFRSVFWPFIWWKQRLSCT